MVWAIAIRNLLQHRTKTLIIGALVSLGIMLTFAGNALIDSVIRNISEIFTEYYTGDILITSNETLGAGVFGAQSDEIYGAPVVPVLKDFDKAYAKVSELPGVTKITRQLSGYALFNQENSGMDFSLFFGIEPGDYFSVMDKIEIVQGRLLQDGEEGMLLEYKKWKDFKDTKGIEYKPGDLIQLNSFGTGGIKIKEVPIVGVFKFPKGNDRVFPMSMLDAKTLRYLLGRSAGAAEKVEVQAQAKALLSSSDDLDALFGENSPDLSMEAETGAVTSSNVFDILGTGPAPAAAPAEEDTRWHFILARTEPGTNIDALIDQLNREFEEEGLLVRAQGWWTSAMPDSLTYSGLQILFNIAIFILAFVAVIIIMNTLVVSVMERTAEIGTMRALGAQKGFVTRMFIAETSFITLVFGALGLILGGLIVLVFHQVGINTDTDALRYIGGGGILRPTVGPTPLILSFALMGVIALFSWIYPVMIALKVSPLKAITSE